MRFSLGVNYWPRRSATAMWRRFDAGEIQEDFSRIAALGLDTVRIFARWDDFQPHAGAADPVMLEHLATVAAIAVGARLRLVPALFCGHMGGVNFLPEWALDRRRPRGPFRTICGERESPYGAGNIYAGPLLDAQLTFARAAAERLGAHPAIAAWDIGHMFSDVHEPSPAKISTGGHGSVPAAEREVAEWSRRLTAALQTVAATPVTAGTHSGDLTSDRAIRLGSLCAPLTFASMQGSSLDAPFARGRLDPEAVPFLAMVTAAFAFKPVMVTGIGNPACPPDKFSAFERFPLRGEVPELVIAPDDTAFATYPCLSDDENAAYCTAVLERLHADGRLGAYWWCWADDAGALDDETLSDMPSHARAYGIVRADGSEKPVAAALAAFARRALDVVPAAEMPMISGTYYYRTLPTSAATLYDAFHHFVSERR